MYAKANSTPKHFLELSDFTAAELNAILDEAQAIKKDDTATAKAFERKSLAMLFDKDSLRTVGSFNTGFFEMGGNPVYFSIPEMGLNTKESVEHAAGYLSQDFAAISIRVSDAGIMREFARHAGIPVVNAMTDESHPCQIMADALTMRERLGGTVGKKVVFAGDVANNIANTYQQAAGLLGFHLTLTGPKSLLSNANMPKTLQNVTATANMADAVAGADVIVTDVWRSKGQAEKNEAEFAPYQVNEAVMRLAKPSAIFLHCMPVSAGYQNANPKEVTAGVLNSPQSAMIQQAGNRRHVQKAILLHCRKQP